jgi:hypothetical protein
MYAWRAGLVLRGFLSIPSARTHDPQDDDAVRFATVEDDVMFEVILADASWFPVRRMPDVGVPANPGKGVIQCFAVDFDLAEAPFVERVLKDVSDVLTGSRQDDDINT